MPRPSSKIEVQRFLGAVNYFGKFLPNLSKKTEALRYLIKQETAFVWQAQHDHELKNLLDMLTSAPVLAVSDPAKLPKVSVDVSSFPTGVALFQQHNQGWSPVACASRVLSTAEAKYAQIEKETLAETFACESARYFLVGYEVVVEADHRPHLAIATQNLCEMPSRLQRYFLRLMLFDVVFQYMLGKQLVLARTLSRIQRAAAGNPNLDQDDITVHAAHVLSVLVSDSMKARMASATGEYAELEHVIEALHKQRPVLGELAAFSSKLSYIDGILLRGSRVVMPKSLRHELLQHLHDGHLGVNKFKRPAQCC